MIRLGDVAAAAWRTLPAALAVLDRVHRVGSRLLVLAGRELGAGEVGGQRWLDRASAGPLRLTPHPGEIPV